MFAKQISSLCVRAIPVLALSFAPLMVQAADDAGARTLQGSDPIAIYKEAGIDAKQEEKIHDIVKTHEEAQKVRVKQMMVYLKELRELSQTADPDEATVLAKQEQINKLHDEIATERTKLMLTIRYTLTPEQRQKLVTLVKKKPDVTVTK